MHRYAPKSKEAKNHAREQKKKRKKKSGVSAAARWERVGSQSDQRGSVSHVNVDVNTLPMHTTHD